jgi:tetratricopeptide (TPR) repeat protein
MRSQVLWQSVRVLNLVFIAIAIVHSSVAAADPPKQAMLAYLNGIEALEQAQWDEAVTAFTQALAGDSDNANFVLARGVSYVLGEQFPLAEPDLKRAMQLTRANRDVKLWLETLYYLLDRKMDAFNLAVGSPPNSASVAYFSAVRGIVEPYQEAHKAAGPDIPPGAALLQCWPVQKGLGGCTPSNIARDKRTYEELQERHKQQQANADPKTACMKSSRTETAFKDCMASRKITQFHNDQREEQQRQAREHQRNAGGQPLSWADATTKAGAMFAARLKDDSATATPKRRPRR